LKTIAEARQKDINESATVVATTTLAAGLRSIGNFMGRDTKLRCDALRRTDGAGRNCSGAPSLATPARHVQSKLCESAVFPLPVWAERKVGLSTRLGCKSIGLKPAFWGTCGPPCQHIAIQSQMACPKERVAYPLKMKKPSEEQHVIMNIDPSTFVSDSRRC